jgi:hypothetical protein
MNTKKLSLNKETLRILADSDSVEVAGGVEKSKWLETVCICQPNTGVAEGCN